MICCYVALCSHSSIMFPHSTAHCLIMLFSGHLYAFFTSEFSFMLSSYFQFSHSSILLFFSHSFILLLLLSLFHLSLILSFFHLSLTLSSAYYNNRLTILEIIPQALVPLTPSLYTPSYARPVSPPFTFSKMANLQPNHPHWLTKPTTQSVPWVSCYAHL